MVTEVAPATAYLGLDVGERRIGVAYGDGKVAIAVPLTTLLVDGTEKTELYRLISERHIGTVVVGLPRNQSGEITEQSRTVQSAVRRMFDETGPSIRLVFQDESLTSIMAEEHLHRSKRAYAKGDIDMHAAQIILQDYLDAQKRSS